MAVINADIEQVWQTIEALRPEERAIIQERLGFEKTSKNTSLPATSTVAPLGDEIFKISFEEYLALSGDERRDIRLSGYSKFRNWIEEELQRRQAEWMIVIGGKIIQTGQTLDDYPSRDKLYKIGRQFDRIPFVFIANPVIEESSWAALPKNDFYPGLSITVQADDSQSSQNRLALQADFDTGSLNMFFDYDNVVEEHVIDDQPNEETQEGLHLSRKYHFHILTAKISIADETGKILSGNFSALCVHDWRQSPLCITNPSRKALVGRKLLLRLPIRIELNGQERSTKIFAIS